MGAAEFRYKAFISYSHQDEEWGKWLQKSLESFRVPRRMVGSPGRYGKVPARVAPVFRDREDLSSAADLSASVRTELAASETLVVICSPAAAASPWVNEEIRFFRALGREERIFTLIVDGDPKSQEEASRCFPPALLESEDGIAHEPLGADARKWADGRSLARLKLVAGILGIRLDDLRRRDMQRKQRLWTISAGAAIAIALLTSILAVVAVTARNKAETRRQHAENLVDYMVDDLKEKLDEVGRLDILGGVGDEVSKYLETLDAQEETEDSLLQKAKVWRQLGEVGMSQGKLDSAMTAFEASRQVTRELLRRMPMDKERIFEMGQAEFWVGYVHLEKGEFEAAREPFENYLLYSNRLSELEPDNPEWIMEQSYAHGNIAALINRQESGDVQLALDQIKASVELNRRAMELAPENQGYISEYGEALAWQADTQMRVCDLGNALISRQENLSVARESLEREPANMSRHERLAWSLSGLANVANQVGLTEQAIEYLEESAGILRQLYQADPTNVGFRWDQLSRRNFVFFLQAELEDPETVFQGLRSQFEHMQAVLLAEGEETNYRRREWIAYLLRTSEVAWRADEVQEAERLWTQAVRQLADWSGENPETWQADIVLARFLIWHYRSDVEITQSMADSLPNERIDENRGHLSCEIRHSLIRQALLEQEETDAKKHADYLLNKGYFEPGFIRLCTHYNLCQGQG